MSLRVRQHVSVVLRDLGFREACRPNVRWQEMLDFFIQMGELHSVSIQIASKLRARSRKSFITVCIADASNLLRSTLRHE